MKFSNGADLTASDVRYSFERLLTNPRSVNDDVVDMIAGAKELQEETADSLSGFQIADGYDFTITLSESYAAFLADMSVPGASIVDEDTTEAAGERFGTDPSVTIGTGPFVFSSWRFNSELLLTANKDCWGGAPACDGADIHVVPDEETQRMMFGSGGLDILDLANVPSRADYFINSDTYKNQIVSGPVVETNYIALNENVAPLDNVKVRKALQKSIDRQSILDAMYGGRGELVNGIFPKGLIGCSEDLPEIPYDVEDAKQLLSDAGYPDGFDMEIHMSSNASTRQKDLLQVVQSMWAEIGVNATIETVDEATFADERHGGETPATPPTGQRTSTIPTTSSTRSSAMRTTRSSGA